MAIDNTGVAELLSRLADLLDIKGDNPFRVRAYRLAAAAVEGLPEQIPDMIARGATLSEIPGIGRALEEKIRHLVETGRLELLEELEREIPPSLLELSTIPGLGPKKISALHRKLGVRDLAGLLEAAAAGKIRLLSGFGEKTEVHILREAREKAARPARTDIARAGAAAADLLAWLQEAPGLEKITVAGSFRRRAETVGDLDILAVAADPSGINRRFTGYERVARVIARGDTKSSVTLVSGLQVDLRVIPRESYGAALHYFTGSKAHNVAIRKLAVRKNLKINEYGVFSGPEKIAGETETSVYRRVGLPWIPPELRENRGEIEAAAAALPDLVGPGDIRGDLHLHTSRTDGRHPLAELVAAARARGYRYLAVCDHSRGMAIARGLSADGLAEQAEEIARLREANPGFHILAGVEVDILADGRLDLPDAVLEKLDIVVAALHQQLNLPEAKQTARLLRAIENPLVSIIAHPTGRLVNRRRPCSLNMERVMKTAAAAGCFLEVNAHPSRLDLNDIHCRLAREHGVRVAISTDAHRLADLEFIGHGVDQARRGWLGARDVINTRPPGELLSLLAQRRRR